MSKSLFRRAARACVCLFLFVSSTAFAALELHGEVNPNPVRPEERIKVEFTVVNTGVSTETDVALEVLMPSGIDGFYSSPDARAKVLGNGNCPSNFCDPGEDLIWDLGSIAAGEARTVAFWPQVDDATVDGTVLSFNAEVFDAGDNLDDSLSAVAVVETGPVLTLAVEDNVDPVTAGDTIRYTVTYGNPGLLATSGTTLTFPVPANTTFVSATGGGSESGGTVTWNLGTLPAGETGEWHVEVTAGNGLSSGDILAVDAATISGSTVEAVPVALQANAQELTQVVASQPLKLAMEVNPDPVRVGELVRVNLTVTNTTASSLSAVELQTRFPALDGVYSSLDSRKAVFGDGNCRSNFCRPDEFVTWSLGDLPANASRTVGYWATALSQADGELLQFDAWVTDAANNEAITSQAAAVYDQQGLALSIDESVDPVVAGDSISYTLTYSNFDVLALSFAQVQVTIPDGATLISASDDGAEINPGVVTWPVSQGLVQPGSSGRLQLELDVSGIPAGQAVAIEEARFSGMSIEAVSREIRAVAQAVTQIASASPLEMAVSVNPDPIRPNELVRVDYTVANNSASTAFDVNLETRIPLELTGFYSDGDSRSQVFGDGNCRSNFCFPDEVLTWSLNDLPVGASTTVSYWAFAGTAVDAELLHFDAVATDSAGNEVHETRAAIVDSDQQLALWLEPDLNPVQSGDALTYTLVYSNFDTDPVTDTVLSLPVPPGTTFVSATGGGSESGGTVSWNLGTLLAGSSGTVSATLTVDESIENGDLLVIDGATLTASSSDTTVQAVAQHVARAASSGLDLVVEVNPDPAIAGELVRNEFTVTNTSGFTLFNAEVEVRVPNTVDDFYGGSDSRRQTIGDAECRSNFCYNEEIITWSLGNLPADGAVTVGYWSDALALNDGELIVVDARATADAGNETAAGAAIPIASNSVLTLAIDETADSIANGGALEYALVFGNRGLTPVENTVVRLPVPEGLTYTGSALGNPTVSNDTVTWNIGDLGPGNGGTVKAAFQVTAATADQIVARPVISGDDQERRAAAVTRVSASSPLGLVADILAPNQPDDTTTVTFDVTNNTGFTLFNAVLDTRVPDEFDSFGVTNITDGGSCGGSSCSDAEVVTWALGNLSAGQTVSVSYETDVEFGLVNGRLIAIDAYATEDTGSQTTDTETVLLGPDSDADQDGINDTFEQNNGLNRNDPSDALEDGDFDGLQTIDEFLLGTEYDNPDTDDDTVLDGADNCALTSNPSQADNEPDGLGDACDVDDDNDSILDVDDNCQFDVNNDQADGDADGVGNACEPPPPADVTEAFESNSAGDVAVLVQGEATGAAVNVYDGASGAFLTSMDFFSWAWQPVAIDTIRDFNEDGTADDPGIAMLAFRPQTGEIRVDLRKVSTNRLKRSISYFGSSWTPIDVAVVNDLNGDGTTGDIGVAVLAYRPSDGRTEVRMVDLASNGNTPSFRKKYFNADWLPIALEGYVGPGGGDSLLSVMAFNESNGKTVTQTRSAVLGSRVGSNIFVFGGTYDALDMSVAADGNGDGTANDPALVFYGEKIGVRIVARLRDVATRSFLRDVLMFADGNAPERISTLTDASGNDIVEIGATARLDRNDRLELKLRDYDTGDRTSRVFPEE